MGEIHSPQKTGGNYVPSSIEHRIATLVKKMREKKLPVFPSDVKAWCTSLIEGTPAQSRFLEGKASEGWYRNFLRRNNLETGAFSPLEMTRAEWLTPDNLKVYYETAEGVLLKAGVAERNQHYDPKDPYSQSIIITHPERIASFDETRVELDQTHATKAKMDRSIRAGKDDRGEQLATKSSATATVVAGRIGAGLALPLYVVFSSGDSYEPAWCRHYPSDVKDAEGKVLHWRYNSNPKGSMTEEFAADYMLSILYPALQNPKKRSDAPGQQGVVFCDGVGTHLGFIVLETAVENGLEIVLRVPHLSYRLQGEDTVNFGPFKVRMPCFTLMLGDSV